MKKIIALLMAVGIVAPAFAFAAFNDVVLSSGTKYTVGGVTLTISDTSKVESTSNDGTTLSVTLKPGSLISVTSPAGTSLSTNAPTFNTVTNTCSASAGATLILNAPSAALTAVITPSSSGCSAGSSGGNGPVSGGGGGGSAIVPAATTTAQTTTNTATLTDNQRAVLVAQLNAKVQALLAQIASMKAGGSTAASGSFTRTLSLGMTGEDVKALQLYLNAHGHAIASSGPGSSGNETTKFGAATKAALIKFQKAVGISPASGLFGRLTRAYINSHP